jgi:hypothetical protein
VKQLVGGLTAALLVVLAAACSSGGSNRSSPPSTTSTVPTDASGVEWLCRPGLTSDPCTSDLTAVVASGSGQPTVRRETPATNAPIDCFYVYPTVSQQPTVVANRSIDQDEITAAIDQVSRFSPVCNVYAPVYRQLTSQAITNPTEITAADIQIGFSDVVAAWKDYVANDNHGRGVVLIGHSQGAAMLIGLVHNEIDPQPSARHLLVSAVLLGGNVVVPTGRLVGGSFAHVPACTSATETGCVIAYSSYLEQPPPDSLFARVGTGVSLLDPVPSPAGAGFQVLCVNPAAPGGGVGALDAFFPLSQDPIAGVTTPWIEETNLYSGQCETAGGATWLQVHAPIHPGDARKLVTEELGPSWGLHLVDVNLAVGNLVSLVTSEARAYVASTH